MTPFERRLLARSATVGVFLTLLVGIVDHFGLLNGLDDWFFDLRASMCQHFTPAPTDRIAHLDIDDQALEEIGHWPWPRVTQARILDEIALANPKAVALDVMYAEPENPTFAGMENGLPRLVDGDAELAGAFSRLHNVLLATSFSLAPAGVRSPLDAAAIELFTDNLELTPRQFAARLAERKLKPGDEQATNDLFIRSRRAAMNDRLSREPDHTPASRELLIAHLLPNADPDLNSPLLHLLDQQMIVLNATTELRRFASTAPKMAVAPVAGVFDVIPIPKLSAAVMGCGVVNYDIFSSATVRSAPLLVQSEHLLYPQMGLSLGCAVLGVDPRTIQIHGSRIYIPRGNGAGLSIPTRVYHSRSLGRDVSLIADIPWFGTQDWRTMYDWPEHKNIANHASIDTVWDLCVRRDKIAHNNSTIDKAIALILGENTADHPGLTLDPGLARKYAAALPPLEDAADREAMATVTLKQLADSGWLEGFNSIADADLKPVERRQRDELRNANEVLHKTVEQNHQLLAELKAQRAVLVSRISGKGVLIGWTAAGTADLVTTSLHPRCPGVVVHGVIANAVISGHWWRESPHWLAISIVLLLGFGTTAAEGFLPPMRGAVVIVILLLGYLLVNGEVLFDYFNWIVPIAGPVVVIAVVAAGCTLVRLVVEGIERNRIATEVAIISREMELARQVQVALIPPRSPSVAGLEAEGWALTASMTGGDCFDLWEMSDGRLAILLADASGHGLAPAMVVSQVRTLVRALSETQGNPQELLSRVNNRLADDLEASRFVTAFLGFLSPDGKLDWASAGHGPMYWCETGKGELQELDSTALPLGVMGGWEAEEPRPPLQLHETGMLVVFSDGIFEAHSPTGELFGVDRLKECLRNACTQSCTEIIAGIRTAVQKWQNKIEPEDDQTIVVARRAAIALNDAPVLPAMDDLAAAPV